MLEAFTRFDFSDSCFIQVAELSKAIINSQIRFRKRTRWRRVNNKLIWKIVTFEERLTQ